MTVKSIMTHIEPTSSPHDSKHLAFALGMAETFGAHVLALVFATEVMTSVPGQSDDDVVLREKLVADQINDAAANRGVTCEVRGRSSFAYGFPDVFSDHARLSDVLVIGYSANPTMSQRMLAGSAIFSSGRPALIVPATVATTALPTRVAIAWDATPASVRALHNALPFIRRAEDTLVVSVSDDKELRRGQSGVEVTHLLARHGAKASFNAVRMGRRSVFNTLHEVAAEFGATMLVMGCNGHSPLYDMVFGSATTDLLHGRSTMVILAAA